MNQDRAPDPRLRFNIHQQPNDVTCGPTCLHAIYRFFADEMDFDQLLGEVRMLRSGGTLDVLLARHALRRGYKATIHTWNLRIFDPTWFDPGPSSMRELLQQRANTHRGPHFSEVLSEYIAFLDEGGSIEMRELGPRLIRSFLEQGIPALIGLSATYLYRESRELADGTADDVHGDPVGHFVVLTGYDSESRQVYVTDPLHPNALSEQHTYPVPMDRLVGAIYLGVLTHDANLIVIEPQSKALPKS